MGRSGMKRSRKGGRRQHLDKVGTSSAGRQEQHLEREAIADTMGLSGAPPWVKWAVVAVGGLLVAIAIAVFISLF